MVVIWHRHAEKRLKEIYDYYLEVAGLNIATKIVSRIRESVVSLESMPLMASIEFSLDEELVIFRSLVITKRHKAIYFVENESIVILDIWDCRQNPDTLKERAAELVKN